MNPLDFHEIMSFITVLLIKICIVFVEIFCVFPSVVLILFLLRKTPEISSSAQNTATKLIK
jgi:hypothetical protein